MRCVGLHNKEMQMKYATTLVLSMALAMLAFGQDKLPPTLESLRQAAEKAEKDKEKAKKDLDRAQDEAERTVDTKVAAEAKLFQANAALAELLKEKKSKEEDLVAAEEAFEKLSKNKKDPEDPDVKAAKAAVDSAKAMDKEVGENIKDSKLSLNLIYADIATASKAPLLLSRAQSLYKEESDKFVRAERDYRDALEAKRLSDVKPPVVTPAGLTDKDKTALAELFKTEADKVANPLKEELKRNTAALAKLESETTKSLAALDKSLDGLTKAVTAMNAGDQGLKGLNDKFAKLDQKVGELGTKVATKDDLAPAVKVGTDVVTGKLGDLDKKVPTREELAAAVKAGTDVVTGKLTQIGADAATAASKANYAASKAEETASGIGRVEAGVENARTDVKNVGTEVGTAIKKIEEVGGEIKKLPTKPAETPTVRALPAPAPMPAPVVLYPRWVDEYEAKGGGYAIQGRLPDGYRLAEPFQYRSGPNCRTQYLYVPGR